jgi:hypothetical protein
MAEINNICDLAWQKLSVAIVAQACVDYGKICKALQEEPDNEEIKQTKDSLTQFFRGQWIQMLCDYDGEALMKMTERRFLNSRKRANTMCFLT